MSDFLGLVRQIRTGDLATELDEALGMLVEAVEATTKGGTLTLKLSIAPISKGNADAVSLTAHVKSRLPEPERPKQIFFPTDNHGLARHDPRQMAIDDLAEPATVGPAPLREVS